MEGDRFFGADEAVEYGLVDRIVSASELRKVPSGFAAAAAAGDA
jgi:ATP-dependent protease ClpP protease subunit